jgi:hypothetical protein
MPFARDESERLLCRGIYPTLGDSKNLTLASGPMGLLAAPERI